MLGILEVIGNSADSEEVETVEELGRSEDGIVKLEDSIFALEEDIVNLEDGIVELEDKTLEVINELDGTGADRILDEQALH